MTTTATPRNERLARKIDLATAHLHAIDAALVRRAGDNLAAFQNRELTGPEAEGVLSVTVESLLDIIERMSREVGA